MNSPEQLTFLTPATIATIAERWGTPTFVYSEQSLRQRATEALAFTAPFGLTVRYAMKANPNRHILRIFNQMGIAIDASSGNEIERAIRAGYAPGDILLTSQALPQNFADYAAQGVLFNASSLSQLETWGKRFPGSEVGIRVNPGIGSGHSAHTNVGGPSSSFGIWHEHLANVHAIAAQYNLTIVRLHTHVGSGTDPSVWDRAAQLGLTIIRQFPHATTLNLGGGFKVGRMADEKTTNLQEVSRTFSQALNAFAAETGRRLHLEIEPGSYLVVSAGAIVTTVLDIVNTGKDGYDFIKVDGGMTEVIRPAMYGAQQPIIVVNKSSATHPYIVVGRCCESGDLLTPAPGNPTLLQPRLLQKASIGDRVVIEGTGAYCSSFNVSGYNSFPASAEVLLGLDGTLTQIRRKQTLDELLTQEYSEASESAAVQTMQ